MISKESKNNLKIDQNSTTKIILVIFIFHLFFYHIANYLINVIYFKNRIYNKIIFYNMYNF